MKLKTRITKADNMWSFTDPIWERIFIGVTFAAFVFGGLAAVGAFSSALIGYKITAATQNASDDKIRDANVEIAKATAEAAKANERAVEAQLELEKFKSPRTLKPEQQKQIIEKLKQFSGTTFDMATSNSEEQINLVGQIEAVLTELAPVVRTTSDWD